MTAAWLKETASDNKKSPTTWVGDFFGNAD